MLRNRLWLDLTIEKLNIAGPWLSIGDYNSVIADHEASSTRGVSHSRSAGPIDWFFNEGLIDLRYMGSKFTWLRGLSSTTFKGARLDRGVCTIDWRELFPEALVKHLPIIQSDHAPLLVQLSDRRKNMGNGPFRFQAAWITHREFQNIIQQERKYGQSLGNNVEVG